MATPKLAIITPYADYHKHLVERAAATVAAQTIPCEFIPVYDENKQGPAWARNHGVSISKSPFVTFLDADDLLEPEFAAKTLEYYRPGRYVYTDYIMGQVIVRMCPCTDLWRSLDGHGEWCEPHNVVTSVLHREVFEKLGGFDEVIGRLEDTHFWLKAISRGVCGIHCPFPLVHYTDEGQRSKTARQDPQFREALIRIYRELPNMGCCQETPTGTPEPKGVKRDGDVVVICLWGGNQTRVGRVSGRVYPRNGNHKPAWVDPRDAAAAPEWYQVVTLVEPESMETKTVGSQLDDSLVSGSPTVTDEQAVEESLQEMERRIPGKRRNR